MHVSDAPPAEAVPQVPRRTVLWTMRGVRRLHQGVGVMMLGAFLLTGQYMDLRYDHLRGLDDTTRMLFRSSHIYILLSGLVNLALGLYLQPLPQRAQRLLQGVGSALVLLAAFGFLAGFFVEPFLTGLLRPWTRPAVYAIAIGGVLHLLAGIMGDTRPR